MLSSGDALTAPRIVLGIDPGTNLLGYGIIKVTAGHVELLGLGVVRLGKITDAGEKLHHIYEKIGGLIDGFEATEVAIEAPFFGKNVQSMLKLGRAQGVAIAAAISRKLPVFEYVPRTIKQSICGNGNASTEQVLAMLQMQFKFETQPETMDASDGLAAALCHVYQFQPRAFGSNSTAVGTSSRNNQAKSKSGWAQFVKENPDRLK
jgi:crossover junction endodeoxyribonuclease RuvC